MDIEKLYRNEIDFIGLKSTAQFLALKYANINKITLYAGKKDRRYTLLFETIHKQGLNFGSLKNSGPIFLLIEFGFLESQEGRDTLQRAKSHNYSLEKPFLNNWYIFFKEKSLEKFSLSDPLHSKFFATDYFQIKKYNKFSYQEKKKMNEPLGRFISSVKSMPGSGPIWFLDYSKNSSDFIDDNGWTLSRNGFEKFILSDGSKIMYEREDTQVSELSNQSEWDNKTPVQQDKITCQIYASVLWEKYPELDIVHLIKHPDMKSIAGGNYSRYKEKTLHNWISEAAKKLGKEMKGGRRSKKALAKQISICEKIGIEL